MVTSNRADRWRRYWDKQADNYDQAMRTWDRLLFGDSRAWVCSQATGRVLEVAIGTGLNLGHYPDQLTVTGIDFSEPMLAIARDRASALGRHVELRHGNAHAMPFDDNSFDTVICTFALCAIPDMHAAIAEMRRVLRSGGQLLLADHVASSWWLLRGGQRLLEVITVPLGGEHFLRRPLIEVQAAGLAIERAQRFKFGLVERVVARKHGATAN